MCVLVFCALCMFVYVCMYVCIMYVDFQLQNTDKRVYAQAKVRTKRIKGTESIPMNY